MKHLYAYYCPRCQHVLVVAGRIIGAGHQTKPGLLRRSKIHDMREVGAFDGRMSMDAIRAQVLRGEVVPLLDLLHPSLVK